MTSKRMKKDPSKWYCSFRYVNLDGETKQKKKEGFSTKKEADEYERNFLNNIKFNPEMTFVKCILKTLNQESRSIH